MERYLAIEQIRFRERLAVAWEIEEDLLDAQVPALILQPLVENALQHGVAAREDGGCVAVRAEADGGRLALEVRDNGPGCAPERLGAGIGTANTRDRLRQLFGEDQSFRLGGSAATGALARVEIPLQWTEQGARLLAEAVP